MRKTIKYRITLILLLFITVISFASDFENNMKQGLIFFESGDFEKALDYFIRAVRMKNDSLEARYNLAFTYFKMNNFGKALEETNFILNIYPDDIESIKLLEKIKNGSIELLENKIKEFAYDEKNYIELANIYFLNKEYNSSLEVVDKGLQSVNRSAKLYDLKARIYQAKGDFERALENIEKAFNYAPDDTLIFEHLKKIVDEKSRYGGQVVNNTTENKENVVDIAENYYIQAVNEYEKKNWDAAEENLKKALKLSENNSIYIQKLNDVRESQKKSGEAAFSYSKAVKNYKIGRYLQAVKFAEEALNIIPNKLNTLEVYKFIMTCYKKLENYDRQIEYCNKILEQDKDDMIVWMLLADAYYFKGMYNESKKYFLQVSEDFENRLQKYPSMKENIDKKLVDIKFKLMLPFLKNVIIVFFIILLIGLLIYHSPMVKKRRNYVKAKEFFYRKSWNDVVERLEPILDYKFPRVKMLSIYKMIIFSYIHTREFSKAEELLKESMNLFPNDEDLIYYYAILYLKKNEFKTEALYAYKVYYQKEPDNFRLLKMIVKYFWECKRNPEFEPKIELFDNNRIKILEKVFKVSGDDVEVINLLAEEYEKNAIYNKNSIKVFEKILEHDFENLKVHLFLGKCYVNNSDYEKAIREAKFVFRRDLNNLEAHDVFKKSYIEEGNVNQLLIEYENLLQIDPANSIIIDNIKELRKLRATMTDNVVENILENNEDMFQRGKKLFNDNKLNDSITVFNELFEKGYKLEDTGFFLTYAYLKKDLVDLAFKQYNASNFDEEILENKVKELVYQLASKFEILGDYRKALNMYDKICKVDISYKDVFERYENLALSYEENS